MISSESLQSVASKVALKQQVSLYKNTVTADVYFTFEEEDQSERIAAHKTILGVASPVFNDMFYGDLPEKGDVNIMDATSSEFKIFLEAIYGITENINKENISDTIRLAVKYDCNGVMEICESYLNRDINVDNVCFALSIGLTYRMVDLLVKCRKVIISSGLEVMKSEAFGDVDYLTLDIILIDLSLHANEKQFVDGCMKWARKMCEKKLIDATPVNLRKELGEFEFSHIKFKEMPLSVFLEIERLYPVFSLDEYQDIVTAINRRQ